MLLVSLIINVTNIDCLNSACHVIHYYLCLPYKSLLLISFTLCSLLFEHSLDTDQNRYCLKKYATIQNL